MAPLMPSTSPTDPAWSESRLNSEAVRAVADILHDFSTQRLPLHELIGLLEQHETLHRQQIEQCLGPAARKASIEVVPR